ncbi:hypothetical protein [Pantanalinema sp. GBBB05]|uniref:hypothetical protein n=1 Tax=Pantanalinema sp. GBBB05 TaxID=2604139 RepID=UPI001DBA5357|nr:hypothetical protein [Pantanalinema sp. GBBB05]
MQQSNSSVFADASFPLLVNKHQAARILGISPETLKKYRLAKGSTLVQGIHYYVWNSRVVRYNASLLADWGLNRHNPDAHQKAIELYLASLPANQPKKRGRRVG